MGGFDEIVRCLDRSGPALSHERPRHPPTPMSLSLMTTT